MEHVTHNKCLATCGQFAEGGARFLARHLPIPLQCDLEDIPSLGGSIRPMSTTFGGDTFEHQKFMRFFQT
jgi:hypothetical protein